jgi:hypothetical protein
MTMNLQRREAGKMDFHPRTERTEMSAVAQDIMREYAGVRWPSLNHKGRMARLAGHLGLTHRRVRAIYQNDPSVRLRADEMAAIEGLRQRRIEEANRDDFQALQARVARLEAALAHADAEFHQPQMAALRNAVDGRRGNDVAGPARHPQTLSGD